MRNKLLALLLVFFLVGCSAPQTNETPSEKRYVGNSLEECMRIKFACDAGEEYFSDDKGCGCVKTQEVICPEERPEICTLEYLPVCSKTVLNTGEVLYRTEGNKCTACAEMKVVSYVPGACVQEVILEQEEKKVPVYCEDKQRLADFCTADYKPTCGWANEKIQCFKYPCASTYSNPCEACKNEQVAYWTDGECPA